MAVFRIIRIYDVPAETQIEATDRMMEAILLHVVRDYHVMDYVKTPDDAKGKGRPIDLTPPKGWLKILMGELVTQITGRTASEPKWIKPKVYKPEKTKR